MFSQLNLFVLMSIILINCYARSAPNPAATPATFTVDESYTRPMDESHPILQDVINEKDEEKLVSMFKLFMDRSFSLGIQPILAFGTLLGSARHGQRMPWDDDLDLMIHDVDVFDLVNDLPKATSATTSKWCRNPESGNFLPHISHEKSTEMDVLDKRGRCTAWMLSEDTVLVWKNSGMPWKISPTNSSFPNIDINTYFLQNKTFVVPRHQLVAGHVKIFVQDVEVMFPLSSVRFYGTNVYVPHDIEQVMSYLWGRHWASECMVTYNHHQSVNFFKMGQWPGLENPEANKFTKVKFPCKLMPQKYHGSYMTNSSFS